MSISAGSALIEREINHCPEQQSRRQRMLPSQRVRSRGQYLIVVAIQFFRPIDHKICGAIQRRPRRQKRQRLKQTLVFLSVVEGAIFSLDIIEIRKSLEVSP